MIEAGEVHLADVGDERQREVLVASPERFTRRSDRALVVPVMVGDFGELSLPWLIECDGRRFAVDHARTISVGRLLERTSRITATDMARVRRVLRLMI